MIPYFLFRRFLVGYFHTLGGRGTEEEEGGMGITHWPDFPIFSSPDIFFVRGRAKTMSTLRIFQGPGTFNNGNRRRNVATRATNLLFET